MNKQVWKTIDPKIRDLVVAAFGMAGIDFCKDWLEDDHSMSMQSSSDEWLTLKQAADYAHVSVFTIRRWLRRGLKGRKLNKARCGKILVNGADLRRFIDDQEKA